TWSRRCAPVRNRSWPRSRAFAPARVRSSPWPPTCDLPRSAPRSPSCSTRWGLQGDMGACAILPRIIGQSRASELLYTRRFMTAEEGERWGFSSRIVTAEQVWPQAQLLARQIAEGPAFANTMTKRMLAMEWAMSVEEAIEAEAVAQALCMTTADFERAFVA